jgi:hypothetical protein
MFKQEPQRPHCAVGMGAGICSLSLGRSALDEGMERECEELEQEDDLRLKNSREKLKNSSSSEKIATKNKLSKIVRRRMIPLKGEKTDKLSSVRASSSGHWPWIKRKVRRRMKT